MPPAPSNPVLDPAALLAAVVRELMEPTAGAQAMVGLLERQSLSPDGAACLATLEDALARISATLADAGDLAAKEPLALRGQPFAPRQLVEDLQRRWTAAESAPVLLATYEGDAELSALGDPARLSQVLEAFVGRAAGRGRSAVEATLSARVVEGRVQLVGRLRDDVVFDGDPDRFFTPECGGVALALAARLLSRMGARMEAQRNQGAGVTVRFELDLPQAAAPAVLEAVGSSPEAPRLHVLIVDDNATNRMVAEAFCDMFGCTSDSAEDGAEAVEAVGVRRYDVILMDVKMPRMDGVEATRAIRAMAGPAAATPIVALTANADPEDIRRYLAAGMAGVVEKPIKADRLAEVLDAVLAAAETDDVKARAAA